MFLVPVNQGYHLCPLSFSLSSLAQKFDREIVDNELFADFDR